MWKMIARMVVSAGLALLAGQIKQLPLTEVRKVVGAWADCVAVIDQVTEDSVVTVSENEEVWEKVEHAIWVTQDVIAGKTVY